MQKGTMMIYNIGREINAYFDDKQCNSYLILGTKNILIDTVPATYSKEYIAEIKKYVSITDIDCIFLLSALPERSGVVKDLIDINPSIVIYSTVTGLRNLSEILNSSFNSVMCKNKCVICIGEYTFYAYITPNITYPDCMMLYFKEQSVLFSGELYSSVSNIEDYYNKYLYSYMPACISAINTVKEIAPKAIYPSYGKTDNVLAEDYDKLIKKVSDDELNILVVYTSKFGSNKCLANKVVEYVTAQGLKCELCSLDDFNIKQLASQINKFSGIVLGTYTNNRNLPPCVCQFLSALDVNLVSGKPYFVFGSYGWSNEGIFMANEFLSMLKMKKSCKPVECVFTPKEEDFKRITDAANELMSCIYKQKEKTNNA